MQNKETRVPADENASYEINPAMVVKGKELEELLDSTNSREEIENARFEVAPLSIELGPNITIKAEDTERDNIER